MRTPKDSEKYFALLRIDTVAGLDPETAKQRPKFESLTPLFPHERFRLEWGPQAVAERIMDLVADNEFKVNVDAIDEKYLMTGIQKVANRIHDGSGQARERLADRPSALVPALDPDPGRLTQLP